MKTVKITEADLRGNQSTVLTRFKKSSKKYQAAKLGASNGCATSRGNYHSTWAIRELGWGDDSIIIQRIFGDPRSTWRKMVATYKPDYIF